MNCTYGPGIEQANMAEALTHPIRIQFHQKTIHSGASKTSKFVGDGVEG